jgi:hypothetical protein
MDTQGRSSPLPTASSAADGSNAVSSDEKVPAKARIGSSSSLLPLELPTLPTVSSEKLPIPPRPSTPHTVSRSLQQVQESAAESPLRISEEASRELQGAIASLLGKHPGENSEEETEPKAVRQRLRPTRTLSKVRLLLFVYNFYTRLKPLGVASMHRRPSRVHAFSQGLPAAPLSTSKMSSLRHSLTTKSMAHSLVIQSIPQTCPSISPS